MKWIGQHIVDLIARFRSEVYLEDLSNPATDTDKFLVADSDGKVGYRTGAQLASDIEVSIDDLHGAGVDGAANQLLTDNGDGTVTSEADLLWDNSTLTIGNDDSSTHIIKRADRTGTAGGGRLYLRGGEAVGVNQTGGAVGMYAGAGTGTGHSGNIDFNTATGDAGSGSVVNGSSSLSYFSGEDGSLNLGGKLKITGNVIEDNDGIDCITFDSSGNTTILNTLNASLTGNVIGNTSGSSGTVTSIGNLTGDVTSSNRATTIAADAVTYAKMQNVSATNVVLGRDSAGAGIVEEISAANLRTIINVEDGATADQTNVTGTAATVTAGAQPAITSLGTLSTLTVDNITVNGDSITSSGDLDIVATGNDINVDTDNFTITSATGIKPSLTLKATISNNKPSVLEFVKDKGIAGADGDFIADIYYTSDNDAQEQTKFVLIQGTVSDATDGAEEGKYNVRIKNTSSGFPVDSFILEGNGANTDATIGYGTGSVTTIAGVIELGNASDTTIARSGAGIITVEGKQVFTTNTPALTSAAAGVPAVTMQVRRTITTAEANSMNSTPIVLVPAQGANTVIVPLGGMVRVDRASAQNSSLADWNCHYESLEPGTVGVSSLMHIRRFMYGQTVDTVYHVIPSLTYNETGQNLTNDVNKALEVSFDSATTSNCFTSIEVYMTYQVFNIA